MSAVSAKRARVAVDDGESPFALISGVFSDEELESLRTFYDEALARVPKRGEVLGQSKEDARFKCIKRCGRENNKFDVDYGFYVDLNEKALRKIKAAIDPRAFDEKWIDGTPHALVTLPGPSQQLHTDVQPLFDNDMETPPFLYTLLVNIGKKAITREMGPTEFFGKSDDLQGTGTAPLLQANQGVLFDGMVPHRATSATVLREPTVYIVFRRTWYRDPNQQAFDEMDKNI